MEPRVCQELRSMLNREMKNVHEVVLSEVNRFYDAVKRTRAPEATVTEAITAEKKANLDGITAFVTASDKAMTAINTNCALLKTTTAVKDVQKDLIDTRGAQHTSAAKLAVIPENCEKEMQSNYVPLETLINSS